LSQPPNPLDIVGEMIQLFELASNSSDERAQMLRVYVVEHPAEGFVCAENARDCGIEPRALPGIYDGPGFPYDAAGLVQELRGRQGVVHGAGRYWTFV
jgi:hypothetical protein